MVELSGCPELETAMNLYRTSGFELPHLDRDHRELPRAAALFLVAAVLLFASYALVWSAAEMRAEHTPVGVVAAPWPVR
jgi:hypothetical protein